MENTCVLTILPIIPEWKIYNTVQRKPVHYCSILSEKREFQAALENALSSENAKKNSCSIIDKKVNTSQDKSSLEVTFLNKTSNCFYLCLGLTVSADSVLKRRNNLLVYLKNNNSDLKYQIQNQNIYVKCDTSIQWNIFYNLFEFLLLKYGISVIGILFYSAIFTNCMLDQEKRFLYNLSDTKAHMKNSTLTSSENVQGGNIKSSLNKSAKNMFASFNQNIFANEFNLAGSEDITLKTLSQSLLKRKIVNEDDSLNCDLPKGKVFKLKKCNCRKMQCKCHVSKWQLHKSIINPNIKSYTDMLLLKGVTTSDELSFAQDDLRFSSVLEIVSTVGDESLLPLMENSGLETKNKDPPFDNSFIYPHSGPSNIQTGKCNKKTNVNPVKELITKPESLAKAVCLLSDKQDEKVNISLLFDDLSDIKKSNNATTSFDMFQTASGKKINVSSTALKAAEKMFSDADESTSSNPQVGKFVQNKRVTGPSIHKPVLPSVAVNIDENMDGILAENFFDDFCFDDKETENLNNVSLTQSTTSVNVNKSDKTSPVGKVRKSLGLRRSVKPYAIPK